MRDCGTSRRPPEGGGQQTGQQALGGTCAPDSSDAPRLTWVPVPVPTEIEWGRLSPRGREIAKVIGLRAAAGLSASEIAAKLDEERPALRYLELPHRPVRHAWVLAQMRALKAEILEVGAARF